ncbi:MAG: adenylate/guanylate cyclase domain-containing protein [Pseudomonadota bacterium]
MLKPISIATVATVGIGTLVGGTVALALFLGLSSAATNTRSLLEAQIERFIDGIEARIADRLDPVIAQADWVVDAFASGRMSLDDLEKLDAFMLGALAATPQVAGMGIVEGDGNVRRWSRDNEVISESWADRKDIQKWLRVGQTSHKPTWRDPFWTQTIDEYVLLHDAVLRADGAFVGMLGQIVPIADISATLVDLTRGTPFVPFVLHDRSRVLAHPSLVRDEERSMPDEQLRSLERTPDPVLRQIWLEENRPPRFLSRLARTEALVTHLDDREYAFLFREIDRFGERPWIVGVYFDLESSEASEVRRLWISSVAGLIMLGVSVWLAIRLGRRFARPVEEIASVARLVASGKFEDAPTLPGSRVRELNDASRSINAMIGGLREREAIRETLGRYVPEQVAKNLLSHDGELAVEAAQATILFCDIEDFTGLTEALGPEQTVGLLNQYFSAMVAILERYDGVVTQFQGDAILAVFNVPLPNADHARNAIQAGQEMLSLVGARKFQGHSIQIRIGINTGRVVAGAVGAEGRLSYTVHGDAVNLASRLETLNKEYGSRILVSGSTATEVPDAALTPRGRLTIRGHSHTTDVYELDSGQAQIVTDSLNSTRSA